MLTVVLNFTGRKTQKHGLSITLAGDAFSDFCILPCDSFTLHCPTTWRRDVMTSFHVPMHSILYMRCSDVIDAIVINAAMLRGMRSVNK